MSSTGSLKQKVRQFIDELRALSGIKECVIVSNDGILIGKTFEDTFAAQSFGAMCATMIASSEAAASVMNITSPSYVLVRGDQKIIIVTGAGPRLLIAAIAAEDVDLDDLSVKLKAIGERIGGAF